LAAGWKSELKSGWKSIVLSAACSTLVAGMRGRIAVGLDINLQDDSRIIGMYVHVVQDIFNAMIWFVEHKN
jgi:hypothetical protein